MILWYALAHMRTKGLLLIYLATQDVTNSHSPCVHRVQQVLYCAAPLVKQNGLLANAKSSLSYEVKAQYSETPWPCKAHVPASRYTQGTPRTHPGHTQDTPRTHPGHTQNTPRTHPGHTQDTPRTHPGHTHSLAEREPWTLCTSQQPLRNQVPAILSLCRAKQCKAACENQCTR